MKAGEEEKMGTNPSEAQTLKMKRSRSAMES